jgi:hypothetical protein
MFCATTHIKCVFVGWRFVRRCGMLAAHVFNPEPLQSITSKQGVYMNHLHRRLIPMLLAFFVGSSSAGVLLSNGGEELFKSNPYSDNNDARGMIEFINITDSDLFLYWLDFSGAPVYYNTFGANSVQFQRTYLTHPWLVLTALISEQDTPSNRLFGIYLPQSKNDQWCALDTDVVVLSAVPEPSAMQLWLLGLVSLLFIKRWKREDRCAILSTGA